MPEQCGVRGYGCPRLFASTEIRLKFCNYAIGEREASRFEELGTTDLDGAVDDVEIVDIQTHDFTNAETGAVGPAPASYAVFGAAGVIGEMEN